MKAISIVIPMYNVASFIETCIESIYSQNVNLDLFQVILVDDESPDNSLEIALHLSKNHPNLSIISQKNKGLGGARNTGIKNSVAKYVWFHDPDDVINPGMLQTLIDVSTKSIADCIEFGAKGLKENKTIYQFLPRFLLKPQIGVDYAFAMETMNSACNKLYSVDFLSKNNLFFLEHIYCEDIEFNSKVFRRASSIETVQNIVSSFVQTADSITRNTNPHKQQKMIRDLIFLIQRFSDFRNEESTEKNIIFWENRLTYLNVTLFYQYIKYKKGWCDLKAQKRELKKNNQLFLNGSITPWSKNLFRLAIKYFL